MFRYAVEQRIALRAPNPLQEAVWTFWRMASTLRPSACAAQRSIVLTSAQASRKRCTKNCPETSAEGTQWEHELPAPRAKISFTLRWAAVRSTRNHCTNVRPNTDSTFSARGHRRNLSFEADRSRSNLR